MGRSQGKEQEGVRGSPQCNPSPCVHAPRPEQAKTEHSHHLKNFLLSSKNKSVLLYKDFLKLIENMHYEKKVYTSKVSAINLCFNYIFL